MDGLLLNVIRFLLRTGVIQSTLNGADCRYGVIFWAGMLAGLIGRRESDSSAHFTGALRVSPYGSRTLQAAAAMAKAASR